MANISGLSTLGITLGYGVESTAGTKPATFNALSRINSIGGIAQDVEQIDSSALEDTQTKYVAGRADSSGTWEVQVNFTSETIGEWEDLITAYNALSDNKQMWFEVIVPTMTDGLFVVAQPPQNIPLPEMGQNELLVVTFTLSIVEYKGASAKVDLS